MLTCFDVYLSSNKNSFYSFVENIIIESGNLGIPMYLTGEISRKWFENRNEFLSHVFAKLANKALHTLTPRDISHNFLDNIHRMGLI